MKRPKIVDIHFPLGGIDRKYAYQSQPPYTTYDAVNVRPIDPLEGRARGGSRPTLAKAYPTQLGSGSPIKMLADVTAVRDDGFRYYFEQFLDKESISDRWSIASWIGYAPNVLPWNEDDITELSEGGLVLDAISDHDPTQRYSFGIFILPWDEAHHGEYRLYGRMNDTTPVATTDGFVVALTLSGSTGSYSGTLKAYNDGSSVSFDLDSGAMGDADGGWLIATVNGGTVTVYWRGVELASEDLSASLDASGNHRVGFGMQVAAATTADKVCVIDSFHINYYSTTESEAYRKHLVAVSNGKTYIEDVITGILEEADASNPSLASDRVLQCAEWGQKLFIADNSNPKVHNSDGTGTVVGVSLQDGDVSDFEDLSIDIEEDVVVIYDGDLTITEGAYAISSFTKNDVKLESSPGSGNFSYRIERAPKTFNPKTGVLEIHATSEYDGGVKKGSVPTGCSLVCRYFDCIVFAGDRLDPHLWYMSRSGDPLDFDYAADPDDPQKAVWAQSADAGRVGEPITCLIPHNDDYLIMGGTNSLWVLRGHPAYSGAIDNLSKIHGVVSANSWCYGPNDEVLFLSRNGLFIMGAGSDAIPVAFSIEKIPRELLNVDRNLFSVSMSYDPRDNGVHLFITPVDSLGDNYAVHWWIDWESKSFYRVSTYADFEPFTVHLYATDRLDESRVLLGGRDGYIRSFLTGSKDDGETMNSSVILGPIRMGRTSDEDGIIDDIFAILDKESGDVSCELYVGNSPEDCLQSSAVKTKTLKAGINNKFLPSRRGACFMLKITATGQWAFEKIQAKFRPVGPLRLP